MLGFGKKKSVAPAASAPVSAVNPNTAIFTMPEKFQIPDKPKFWTAWKVWTLVAILAMVLIGGVVFALYRLSPQPAPPAPTPEVDTAPVVTPTPTLPTPEEEPPISPPVETPPEPVPPTTPAPSQVLPRSSDTDADGLTDAEETLLGTSLAVNDTDADGYTDAAELMNGYNPAGAGLLAASVLRTVESSRQRYQFRVPASWTSRYITDAEDEVHVAVNLDETMIISLLPLPPGQTLASWYQSVNPTAAGNVATETIGGKDGVLSADRRTFYFTNADRPETIVMVSYNVGSNTEVKFSALFELLIKTFAFTPAQ